ncbi:hypothetical protein FE257_007425 [Aspergillus nanangensis]|uniref:Uncharacterized protein n=1 Tax=Aspergillus nanangensis TaxID=2582783 RepID=A0AAD4GU51_ASPNN|nr:hypothetical protein FE257_007425 [Aspergillus nanangensis]
MAPAILQPFTSSPPQTSAQNGDSYDSQTAQDPKFLAGYQAASRIKQLEEQIADLWKEMQLKIEKNRIAIDEVVDRRNEEKEAHKRTKEMVQSLEKAIKKEKNAFDGQKEEIKSLQSEAKSLQSRYSEERGRVASAWSEIDDLKQKITSRESTITELKSAGSQLKERYAASKDRIRELRAESSDLNQLLTDNTTRLSKLEGFATGFIELDEDHLIDEYALLWEYARNEIYLQLEIDLDSKVLGDSSAWEELRNCDLAIQHRIPLPSSNSLAAKQMRLAIILAILAREIDRYIFQPTYSAGEDCPSRKSLANLAAVNAEKEAFCRSMLFSLDPESQSKSCQWRIRRIVQNVSSYLCVLLSDEQHDRFCQSLQNVVQKAVEIWHPIQRARRKYESDFEPADSDDETMTFVFPGLESVETASNVQPQHQSPLIIFPHIYAIEGNKKILYTPTCQLSSMHPQWVAAEQEMRQDAPSSTFERVVSARLRKFVGRRSTSNH